MSAGHFGACLGLGTLLFVVSACSGKPSSEGAIVAGGAGTAGNTSASVTGGSANGGTATSGGTSAVGTQASATIVPLYSYPTEAPWAAIVSAKLAHPSVPVIAIVNVDNGPQHRGR